MVQQLLKRMKRIAYGYGLALVFLVVAPAFCAADIVGISGHIDEKTGTEIPTDVTNEGTEGANFLIFKESTKAAPRTFEADILSANLDSSDLSPGGNYITNSVDTSIETKGQSGLAPI